MNYHLATFHKCASNWIRRLFRHIADQRGFDIWVNLDNPSPLNRNVDRGAADALMIYAVGPRSLARAKPDHDARRAPDERTVICVRDPKDVLVSQYWSWRNTHANNTPEMLHVRSILRDLGVAEGLAYLVETDRVVFCTAIRQWYEDLSASFLHLVRYEDLLADFSAAMTAALRHLGLEGNEDALRDLEHRYSFKSLAEGRAPGEENRMSHFRKGISGDWHSYAEPDLARSFDAAYGDVCDRLGYERASEV
jgi:hypothetical protein